MQIAPKLWRFKCSGNRTDEKTTIEKTTIEKTGMRIIISTPVLSRLWTLGIVSIFVSGLLAAAETTELQRVPSAEEVQTSPLADAAMVRDVELVISMLIRDEKPDVNAWGKNGTPALHWVVRYGDIDTAEWLVGAGADVNLPNLYGVRPLQLAIENGHLELVNWLLERGADPEALDRAGEPPIFLAARMADMVSIDFLLKHGAKVDSQDTEYGQTALMIAVREGHANVVQLLISAGADLNTKTRQTETMPGKDQILVLPNEIPGTLTNGVGIIRGGWPERGKRQPIAGAKTPLLYASRLGDLEITQMLVESGADIEITDANGITPLINAIINKSIVTINPGMGEHLKVASFLVSAGADVNKIDWYGQSPLWAAIDVRNLIYRNVAASKNNVDREEAFDLITQILEAGADPNVQVKEFPPSRHFILGIGSVEWVDITGQTSFLRAALAGDVRVMRLLLGYGADPNIYTYSGTTPLMVAAGIDWAMGQTFDEGPEALLEAVILAHEQGNDVNALNNMGLQAVHGAANRGSNNIIEYLAANGAELNNPDNEGRTPISWAEGEYLPSRPLIYKPETISILKRLQQQ